MSSKTCVALLCLSVSVAVASSPYAGMDGTDLSQWVMESASEALPADKGEEQARSESFTPPPAQLAVPGLAQLVHRMTLFSHALNLSTTQARSDNEQRVREGLLDLVRRVTLFSHALNLSSSEGESSGDGNSDQRVREGLVNLERTTALFSHSLNQSSGYQENGGNGDDEQKVSQGLTQLVERMTLFSHALNLSHGDGEDGNEQRVSKGLSELVQRMTLLSTALEGDHLQYLPSTSAFPPSPPVPSTSPPGNVDALCIPVHCINFLILSSHSLDRSYMYCILYIQLYFCI